MKWYSSDWHLDWYNALTKGYRAFKSIEEMNETIVNNMLGATKRGDIFYFLGDIGNNRELNNDVIISFHKKGVRFVWVEGNHDKKLRVPSTYKTEKTPYKFVKLTDKDGTNYQAVLSHTPYFTWDKSHANSFNLYGHHHTHTNGVDIMDKFEKSGKRLNVNCEFNNYKPYSEIDVINIMKTRPDNWDFVGNWC